MLAKGCAQPGNNWSVSKAWCAKGCLPLYWKHVSYHFREQELHSYSPKPHCIAVTLQYSLSVTEKDQNEQEHWTIFSYNVSYINLPTNCSGTEAPVKYCLLFMSPFWTLHCPVTKCYSVSCFTWRHSAFKVHSTQIMLLWQLSLYILFQRNNMLAGINAFPSLPTQMKISTDTAILVCEMSLRWFPNSQLYLPNKFFSFPSSRLIPWVHLHDKNPLFQTITLVLQPFHSRLLD